MEFDDDGNLEKLVVPGRIRKLAWTLFSLQFVALCIFSTVEYSTFALGSDFAGHAQAWFAISHGHFDPWSSIFGTPFYKNNAEFLFWPLALLYYVYPHSVDLLWIQDAAAVATELVVFSWVCQIVERHRFRTSSRIGLVIVLVSIVAQLANPWLYQTIAFDFHMEPFTALFAILAGRALWLGRFRQLWWWVPLTLLTAALGGLAVLALGVTAILMGRTTRRVGVVLLVVGLGWFIGIGSLGLVSVGGIALSTWYGYLTHSHGHVGVFDVVVGLTRHPFAALHLAASRWYLIFGFLSVVGLIGVVSPWGLPMAIAVMGPGAINSNVSFILPHASFQNWPALPFVLVGSLMLLLRLADSTIRRQQIARAVGAVWIGSLVALAAIAIPEVPQYWLSVERGATTQLEKIDHSLPADAEVVTSGGIVGRFADRSAVYFFFSSGQLLPVTRREVVFVLTPSQGVSPTPSSQTRRAVAFIGDDLGAKAVVSEHGVFELVWFPPRDKTRLFIP